METTCTGEDVLYTKPLAMMRIETKEILKQGKKLGFYEYLLDLAYPPKTLEFASCQNEVFEQNIMDRYKDIGYNREVLQSGVFVDYDSTFRWAKDEENWTYNLLEHLLPDFPDQITMGMDTAKHSY